MDEEDDDFYAPNGDAQVKSEDATVKNEHGNGNAASQDEDMDALDNADNDGDDDDEEDDDDDDDDDDSDVDIITERQDGAVPEPPPQARPFRPIKPELPRTASIDTPASASTTRNQQPPTTKLDQPGQAKKVAGPVRDGSKYPEVRSSSIDVNAIPTWGPVGKSITQVDIDTDLAEHAKPWRLPGTDQTDYFNYGFDEFTWTQYCLRQPAMASVINSQKQEHKQLEMMFNPTGPGPQPGAMNMGMPGMPDPETMSAMMAQMQGVADPSQLDFGTFMQQMQSMGGMPGGPGGPQYGAQPMQQQNSNQPYGGQQHNQQNYPHQQQQGAQGYGGGTPQPQSQGQQQPSFEGYSAQQVAMMQGQGGGGPPQGPGGGRGRGRGRGRGHW